MNEPRQPGSNGQGAFGTLYGLVLRFCPRDFRDQYGADLLATVAAREADWTDLGWLARQHQRVRELGALLRGVYGMGDGGGRTGRSADGPIRFPGKGNLLDDLRTDVYHSVRRLARSPGFTFVAVFTLALGIGASTAIFSLVNGILVEPLPYPDADRLVGIWNEAPGSGIERFELSDALYFNYREGSTSFDEIAIWGNRTQILTGGEEPVRVEGAEVTPSFFAVLQIQPALGRVFTEGEGAPRGDPVVIISDALWSSRFGSVPDILGRSVEVSGVMREIVGVMPADFLYPAPDTQMWTPFILDEDQLLGRNFSFYGLGRLRQGLDPEDALVEMKEVLWGIVERVPGQFSAAWLETSRLAPILTTMKEDVVGDIGQVLWVLMGTVGFVLLIACANVANLFLVRAEGSQREIAVRIALGAGRGRVMRFYLTESAVLGLFGGVAGLTFAWAAIRIVVALDSGTLPRLGEVSIDGNVLAFAVIASLGSALAFGSFPAFRLRFSNLVGALKDGGRGATGGRSHNRMRHTLVVAQVALALVLLVGSGLMLRSFAALRNVDPGFDAADALSMNVSLPAVDYPGEDEVSRFILDATERIAGLPGVVAAGTTSLIGLSGGGDMDGLAIEDFPQPETGISHVHPVRVVSPDFFAAMGIPLIEGRLLDRRDSVTGGKVVLASKAFADNFWPGGSALGKRVRGYDREWYTIVGVVDSIREKNLQDRLGQTIYLPLQGHSYLRTSISLVVRTTGNPTAILPAVREQVWAVDPDLAISAVGTLERLVADSMARTTFTMAMLGIAAGVALLLGTVGIYGVISCVVSQRTAEIGVRMALGAQAGEVSSMVVHQGMAVVAIGVVLGLASAVGLMRFMASLLFEVNPLDPVTFVAVPLVLIAAGVIACVLPARRAASVDPAVALRAQ